MKIKSLLGLAFALVITFGANAQEFGARVGGNLSSINYSADGAGDDAKSLFGLQFGGTALLPINDNLKINASLLYTQAGERYEDGDATTKFIVNYLQLPVAVEYGFGGDQIKPFIQAGPYLGYAIGAKVKVDGGDVSGEADLNVGNSEDDDIAPMNFGFTLGGGVDIQKFRVGVNYDLGLSDLTPKDLQGDETAKTSVFSLNVSYFFNR
ncbi:porin family protein [Mangrovivirga cuniculi]|uniref:Outer membrane protein beta-barrel domain-containing protein n=1 Tax=Mangrovivirga cuniculi TaxID=2715131 RepID=A0A4D7JMU8_9BACT|nr:porin family protein [Mangrovivirga cuniculi]QCK15977.1 hypothetical protein DCC35_15130 [Mangrovivirga cuniculi]